MAEFNQVDTLNGHFKESYADKIKDLIPEGVKFFNMVPFNSAEKQPGNFYHQPVILGLEHGFTYGGAAGSAFTLQAAVASSHADAQVRGHELVLRSYLSVGAASRSKSKNAFIQETKLLVQNMLKSMARRLEVQMMYGQSGIGIIETATGGGNTIIKVEDHEWAAGIWSGSEAMPIEIRSAAGALRGSVAVVSNSLKDKTVTVDTDLSTLSVVPTDVIWYKGAYGNEFAGLHKIITNTATLFNVDASAYSLFRGNTVEVGTDFAGAEAVLSFAKIEEAIAVAMEKGLADEDVVVLCNPKSWNNLLTEQAAKRRYDSSFSGAKVEAGHKEIVFHGQNGLIKIVSTIYVKEGYAYVFPVADFMRVGSSDVTFEQPGFEGKFMRLLENANAYEMRCYTDQALFTPSPGLCTLLTFIKS